MFFMFVNLFSFLCILEVNAPPSIHALGSRLCSGYTTAWARHQRTVGETKDTSVDTIRIFLFSLD